jgi:hypothetical protein
MNTTLAAETNGYVPGNDYQLRVLVSGNELRVRLNGALLFGGSVLDASLPAGTIALYSWGSDGLSFSNLLVTPPYQAPVVSFRNPAAAAVFKQFTSIPVSVSASDPDGTVVSVEVLDGTNRLAAFYRPPYEFGWLGAAPGDHTLIARATDDTDLIGTAQIVVHVAPAYPLPVWLLQPQTQTVPAGSGLLLSARTQSSWPLSYQWYLNGQPVTDATGSMLLVNGANPDSAGDYWLVVSNLSGSITSRVAAVSVVESTNGAAGGADGARLAVAGFDDRGVPVLALDAEPSTPFTVQASSLNLTDWTTLFSLTNTGRPFYFSDSSLAASNAAAPRFYRTVRTP